MENVVLALFKVESEAYQAITELKNATAAPDAIVSQAVLVKKENGVLNALDSYDTGAQTNDDTIAGGLIGGFVGILGGPIGVLLGGSMGTLVGAAVDAGEATDNASLIEQIAGKLPDGAVAVIALVQEETPAFVDLKLAKFDADVYRFEAALVAHEVEQAKELQKQLEKEAKAQMRKEKSDEFKGKVEERRNKLRQHFEDVKTKLKK